MLMLAIDCTNAKLETIIRLLKLLLGIVQLVIPMGLIVLGSLDLAKGVFAQDESVIKKNQMLFVKRLIAALLVFFTSLIVRIVMGLVGNDAWKDCWDNVSGEQNVACRYELSGSSSFTIEFPESNPEQYSVRFGDNAFNVCTIKKPTEVKGYNATGKCPEKIGYYINGGNCELNANQPIANGPMFGGTYNLKK